jgi:signal transduction histidine kinase
MENKQDRFLPKRMMVQLGLAIAFFIIVIEVIILAFSYYGKKREFSKLNDQIVFEVAKQGIELKQAPISQLVIEKKLNRFVRNVSLMVLLIIVSVVVGSVWIFYRIAGRHIIKLNDLIKESSLHNPAFYPEADIPQNELGEVIRTRNESVRQLLSTTARISVLGDIAAGIAHEINTPLSVIKGNAQLIRFGLEDDPLDHEELNENLIAVETTIDKVARIVKGMHSLSRDGSEDEFEWTNLSELYLDIQQFAYTKVNEVEAILEFDSIDKEIEINCRSYQLFQALLNLIKNACDAVAECDVRVIKVQTEFTDHGVTIHVIDSGEGMSDDIKDRILDQYFTTKKAGAGTGLGLAFTKTIVDQHKGKLLIQQKEGRTCFSMELLIDPSKQIDQKVA